MNYACKLSLHVKKEIIFATDEDIVRKYKAELYVLNRIAGKRVSERWVKSSFGNATNLNFQSRVIFDQI